MNELEKKSFYSFLGLYILSSFLFIVGIGYWYYKAQENALENETYYTLQHIADVKSGEIIVAHMKHQTLKHTAIPKEITLALIDTQGSVVEGMLIDKNFKDKVGYFQSKGYSIFVSDAPREHLNIAYVVVQSNTLTHKLENLKKGVLILIAIASFFIVIVAWILSAFFMRPIRQRVLQIERFINDITHELNTPITSLFMATNQALKKGIYGAKTMNNISISTKQLYDIYRSLTYLNFSTKTEVAVALDLKEVLQKSVEYYRGLADIKHIKFSVSLDNSLFAIPQAQATLLFGNLIGNAIKYSSHNSKIRITLHDTIFVIEDEGIGIEPSQQKEIFEKFKRGTDYSGGFGVGLNIVKSICDEYAIKIELHSIPQEGTVFTLKFT